MIIDALKKYGTYLVNRKRTQEIKMIVVHSTAGRSFAGAWSTLLAKGFGYHALVPDEDEFGHGDIIKCVPDSRVCSHAGNSYGPLEQAAGKSNKQDSKSNFIAKTSCNGYSLGISFVNANDGIDTYSDKQHQACVTRCVEWALAYPSIEWLSTHYFISPKRKTDPKGYNIDKLLVDVNKQLKNKRPALKFWQP
jgi:N-acetyl-anhydromuramyl-L-alanine amidase AmpD